MSNFDKDSIEKLQDLCKIKLTDEEKEDFLKDLTKIIDYIEKLNEINTDNVDPCNYILMDLQQNIFRKDSIKNTLNRDKFLANAPDKIASMIKVFEVIVKNQNQ